MPVLITGRLGDRFGPKNLYLVGLTVFTLASLWCGLTSTHRDADRGPGLPGPRRRDDDAADDGGDHPDLPVRAARPGDGAVGRDRRRGHPGRPDPGRRPGRRARLGVDLLHQHPGRHRRLRAGRGGWCRRCRPTPTSSTGSGVALSGLGMFLLVFGIQEGHQYDWGTITGRSRCWRSIVGGLVVFAVFVLLAGPQPQRAAGAAEPVPRPQLLVWPTSRSRRWASRSPRWRFPIMLYAQLVRGCSPTESALLLVPMAVMSIVLAPMRRPAHRPGAPARCSPASGFAVDRVSLVWLSPRDDRPTRRSGRSCCRWRCSASARPCIWAPLAPPRPATCRCSRPAPAPGVYNATRQVGAVLGSAAIAVLHRLAGSPPRGCSRSAPSPTARRRQLPARSCATPFSDGDVRQRCCCPAAVLVLGLRRRCSSSSRPRHLQAARRAHRPPRSAERPSRARAASTRAVDWRGRRRPAQPSAWPVALRFSQASTTRAAMPASAALPQARGS